MTRIAEGEGAMLSSVMHVVVWLVVLAIIYVSPACQR